MIFCMFDSLVLVCPSLLPASANREICYPGRYFVRLAPVSQNVASGIPPGLLQGFPNGSRFRSSPTCFAISTTFTNNILMCQITNKVSLLIRKFFPPSKIGQVGGIRWAIISRNDEIHRSLAQNPQIVPGADLSRQGTPFWEFKCRLLGIDLFITVTQ